MTRPRSILGLVFRLATLHVERRPGWCAVVLALAVAALLWPRSSGEGRQVHASGLAAAVLQNGFALTYTSHAGRRVVELDAQGQQRRETPLRQSGEVRLVGTRAGAAVGWQEDKRIRLAHVDDDREEGTWGRSVRQLCDGVASNDARFAVGWLESDDSVWIIHGPVAAGASEPGETNELLSSGTALARNEWCGVASAEHNIALLWRSADRLWIAMCSKKACSNLPATVGLDRRQSILGVGCLRNACLFAIRDPAGATRLSLATSTGKVTWNKPLETAASSVSIVGVGDRAFAVGYAGRDGAEVVKLDRDGKGGAVWRAPGAPGAPVVAWSSGRLLIAHARGESVVHETVVLAP